MLLATIIDYIEHSLIEHKIKFNKISPLNFRVEILNDFLEININSVNHYQSNKFISANRSNIVLMFDPADLILKFS